MITLNRHLPGPHDVVIVGGGLPPRSPRCSCLSMGFDR
jgi:hypothetical protein